MPKREPSHCHTQLRPKRFTGCDACVHALLLCFLACCSLRMLCPQAGFLPQNVHILSSCAGRLRVHHSSALVFPPGCCGTFASLLQRSTSHKHTLAPHPKRGPQSWFSKHCYSRSAMVQHPSPGNLLKLPKRGKPQIHTQKTSNAIPPL